MPAEPEPIRRQRELLGRFRDACQERGAAEAKLAARRQSAQQAAAATLAKTSKLPSNAVTSSWRRRMHALQICR